MRIQAIVFFGLCFDILKLLLAAQLDPCFGVLAIGMSCTIEMTVDRVMAQLHMHIYEHFLSDSDNLNMREIK